MIKSINEALSFFLELAMLAAFAYAGFHFGDQQWLHYLLGIGIPVLMIIFWAKRMAPKAQQQLPYPYLLIVTLILFEAAAFSLYFVRLSGWALVFAIVALVNVGINFCSINIKSNHS